MIILIISKLMYHVVMSTDSFYVGVACIGVVLMSIGVAKIGLVPTLHLAVGIGVVTTDIIGVVMMRVVLPVYDGVARAVVEPSMVVAWAMDLMTSVGVAIWDWGPLREACGVVAYCVRALLAKSLVGGNDDFTHVPGWERIALAEVWSCWVEKRDGVIDPLGCTSRARSVVSEWSWLGPQAWCACVMLVLLCTALVLRARLFWKTIILIVVCALVKSLCDAMIAHGVMDGLAVAIKAWWKWYASLVAELAVIGQVAKIEAMMTGAWSLVTTGGGAMGLIGIGLATVNFGVAWLGGAQPAWGLWRVAAVAAGSTIGREVKGLGLDARIRDAVDGAGIGDSLQRELQATILAGVRSAVASVTGVEHVGRAVVADAGAGDGKSKGRVGGPQLVRTQQSPARQPICVDDAGTTSPASAPSKPAAAKGKSVDKQKIMPAARDVKQPVGANADDNADGDADVVVVCAPSCPPSVQPHVSPLPSARRWHNVAMTAPIITRASMQKDDIAVITGLLRSGVLVSGGPSLASRAIGAAYVFKGDGIKTLRALPEKDVAEWVDGKVDAAVSASHAGEVKDDVRSAPRARLRDGHVSDTLKALTEAEAVGAPLTPMGVAAAMDDLFPPAEPGMSAYPVTTAQLTVSGGRSRVRERVAGSGQGAWEDVVQKAVRVGARDAAPGMTGFRLGWLVSAYNADAGNGTPRAGDAAIKRGTPDAHGRLPVSTVIARWIDGILCGDAAELMNVVRLRLIPKPAGGGARPIGVGEAIAGVAKRIAKNALSTKADGWLMQRGQWVEGADACRKLARVMSSTWARGWNVAALDVKNAFNCVHRSAVVDVVTEVDSDLAPFFAHILQPTTMIGEGVTRVVDRGVVQGDPTSSLLFAMVIAKVAERVRDECKQLGVRVTLVDPQLAPRIPGMLDGDETDVVMGWYADDGSLAWKSGAALEVVVDVLKGQLALVGLSLSTPKCKLVPGRGVAKDDVRATAAKLDMAVADAVSLLGMPVGDTATATQMVAALVDERVALLERVWTLGCPFGEVQVLRSAGLASALAWVFEGAAPGVITAELCVSVREHEVRLIRHLFGQYADAMSDAQLRQVEMPLTAGGLGVLSMSRVGELRDGVFVARTSAARVAWDKASADVIREALAPDKVASRRWADFEATSKHKPLSWIGCTHSIDLAARLAIEENDSEAEIASMTIHMILGGRVWPEEHDGKRCPYAHNPKNKNKFPVIRHGLSAHWEQCAVQVNHRRHHEFQVQLVHELSPYGTAVMEVYPTISGAMAPRQYSAAEAKGQKIPGDVGVRFHNSARNVY